MVSVADVRGLTPKKVERKPLVDVLIAGIENISAYVETYDWKNFAGKFNHSDVIGFFDNPTYKIKTNPAFTRVHYQVFQNSKSIDAQVVLLVDQDEGEYLGEWYNAEREVLTPLSQYFKTMTNSKVATYRFDTLSFVEVRFSFSMYFA